jgi:hypothetical protein
MEKGWEWEWRRVDSATQQTQGWRKPRKWPCGTGRGGGPVVFLRSDQNFPAVLPSLDEDSWVEDGTIREITWAIIDILKGIRLSDRTTILLSSVTSLFARDVQSYGEDLVWGIRLLREKLGDGVNVSALPPILINGVNNPGLVRSLTEVEIWFEAEYRKRNLKRILTINFIYTAPE